MHASQYSIIIWLYVCLGVLEQMADRTRSGIWPGDSPSTVVEYNRGKCEAGDDGQPNCIIKAEMWPTSE